VCADDHAQWRHHLTSGLHVTVSFAKPSAEHETKIYYFSDIKTLKSFPRISLFLWNTTNNF
jgi:hypothetical protein